MHDYITEWRDKSAHNGRKWVVNFDEIDPSTTGLKPDAKEPGHEKRRQYDLWATYLAGGAGMEWYCGSEAGLSESDARTINRDRTLEDFSTREQMWKQNLIRPAIRRIAAGNKILIFLRDTRRKRVSLKNRI